MKQNILITSIVATLVLFSYLSLFHWTSVHEKTILRNIITGELTLDSTAGPGITAPWVQAVNMDTRPRRICVECACTNMTCVLVSFEPGGWRTLIEREGFRYFWWDNRFSFNFGHRQEYRGLDDLLKGYSMDGQEHPFIKKHQEL